MRPSYYQVTMTNTGLNTVAPADGFYDPKRIETYMAEGSVPTTLAQTQAKRRANFRWKRLVEKLGLLGAVHIQPSSIVVTATGLADPTLVTFQLQIEAAPDSLYIESEITPGTFLTDTAAIKHCVAKAMVNNETKLLDVYDPTATVGDGMFTSDNLLARRLTRVENLTVGRVANTLTIAEGKITITAL